MMVLNFQVLIFGIQNFMILKYEKVQDISNIFKRKNFSGFIVE